MAETITNNQRALIRALGKSRELDTAGLDTVAEQLFHVPVDLLSTVEASQFIDVLKIPPAAG